MNTHDVPKDFVGGCYQCNDASFPKGVLRVEEHSFCSIACYEAYKKPEKSNWRGWLFIVIAVVFSLMLFMFAQSSHASEEGETPYTEYVGENMPVCFTQEGARAFTMYFIMGGQAFAEQMFGSIKSCEVWSGNFTVTTYSETVTSGEVTVRVVLGLTERNNEFYFLSVVQ